MTNAIKKVPYAVYVEEGYPVLVGILAGMLNKSKGEIVQEALDGYRSELPQEIKDGAQSAIELRGKP